MTVHYVEGSASPPPDLAAIRAADAAWAPPGRRFREDDFAIFILTHGRPDDVSITIGTLEKSGYTGNWYLLLDDEDDTAEQYRTRWGAEKVLQFTKDDRLVDMADNSPSHRGVTYARNANDLIAERLGLTYYLQLDDDYTALMHRYASGKHLLHSYTTRFDRVCQTYIELLEDTGALTVAFCQGGDTIGGTNGSLWKQGLTRKAMNAFFFKVGSPPDFVGRINEDVNMYVVRGMRGDLTFTTAVFQLTQTQTQKAEGGLTGIYLDVGTFVKSFYTVMLAPSAVRVDMMGQADRRFHHRIDWNLTTPRILNERHRKP